MQFFKNFFTNLIRKSRELQKRSNYICYKIVDLSEENEGYILQCINTKAIFHQNIDNIVFDADILCRLHPIQACYIGIEYSKYLKESGFQNSHQENFFSVRNNYSSSRYGIYQLEHQDRKGNLCFTHRLNQEHYIMDPRDIALSIELISEFDATQAFHIGVAAGLKLNNLALHISMQPTNSSPVSYLRLVK